MSEAAGAATAKQELIQLRTFMKEYQQRSEEKVSGRRRPMAKRRNYLMHRPLLAN